MLKSRDDSAIACASSASRRSTGGRSRRPAGRPLVSSSSPELPSARTGKGVAPTSGAKGPPGGAANSASRRVESVARTSANPGSCARLRHTHAAELAFEGAPMNAIQAQLGHSSLATTSRDLAHIAPAELVKAMQARTWSL